MKKTPETPFPELHTATDPKNCKTQKAGYADYILLYTLTFCISAFEQNVNFFTKNTTKTWV